MRSLIDTSFKQQTSVTTIPNPSAHTPPSDSFFSWHFSGHGDRPACTYIHIGFTDDLGDYKHCSVYGAEHDPRFPPAAKRFSGFSACEECVERGEKELTESPPSWQSELEKTL